MAGTVNVAVLGLMTDWWLWHCSSQVSNQTEEPGQPRIIINASLRVGDHVEICCRAPIYRHVFGQVELLLNPNNDETVRIPILDFENDESAFCYTITVVFDHHRTKATCFVHYHLKCQDCSPKEIRTSRFKTLNVFVLEQPNITGPSSVQATVTQCWSCLVPRVSYYVFDDEFFLDWLGFDLEGLSSAYFARKTRWSSPSGPGSVLRIHSVESRVCVHSLLPGMRRLECCVTLSTLPPGTYYRDSFRFTVTPAPSARPTTTTTTSTTTATTTTSVTTTTTTTASVTAIIATTASKPFQPATLVSTAATSTTRKPQADSTRAISTEPLIVTSRESKQPDFTDPQATTKALMIISTSTSTGTEFPSFKRKPRLETNSDGSLIFTISIMGSVLVSAFATIIVYYTVTRFGAKGGDRRKRDAQAKRQPDPSSSRQRHESTEPNQPESRAIVIPLNDRTRRSISIALSPFKPEERSSRTISCSYFSEEPTEVNMENDTEVDVESDSYV